MTYAKTAIMTVLAGGAAVFAMAVPASAAPAAAHAQTYLVDRPDGGNGNPDPYWADDTFTRDMIITLTGGSAGDYTFSAEVQDRGTFTTIPREQTPDQGGLYAGDLIQSRVTGMMNGYADYSFTATELPDAAPNAGVASYENDHGVVSSDSTSTWYELAFPAGTVFGGTGIGDWSWTYDATVRTVTYRTIRTWEYEHHHWIPVRESVPVVHAVRQQWTDAWDNGYGDLPADGNISG